MEPPLVVRKGFVVEGCLVIPVNTLLVVSDEPVHDDRRSARHEGDEDRQLQEASLEEKVEVSVGPAVGDPVVHFKRLNYGTEHGPEDGEGFGACVHPGFAVSVLEHRQLGPKPVEPELLPAEDGQQEHPSKKHGEDYDLNKDRAH